MLAMAHGFAQGGLIIGFITVVSCGSMAYLGLYLLSLCAAHPSIPKRTASFSSISNLTYPQASILFDLAIAIKCFGVSISYLLIFGKLMPQVTSLLFQQVILSFKSTTALLILDSKIEHGLWLLDRRLWITLSMLFLVPVSFLPTLDSLRHVSYIALIGVLNLIMVVIFKFCFSSDPLPSNSSGAEIHWIKLDSSFLTALPLFVFAYTCAQNIFSVHNEMIDNSPRQMKKVLFTCIGSAVVTYEILGVLGYLTFGSKVSSNLISDYDSSILISISQLMISILVLFSYPLQLLPCRSSVLKVIHHQRNQVDSRKVLHHPLPTTSQDLDREEDVESIDVERPDGPFSNEPTSLKLFVGITALLLLGSFLIAVNVERLETVGRISSLPLLMLAFSRPTQQRTDFFLPLFPDNKVLGFVGSTGSTTISYILPGLFFRKLFPAEQVPPRADMITNASHSEPDRYYDHRQSTVDPQPREEEEEVDNDGYSNLVPERQQVVLDLIDQRQLVVLRKLAYALVVVGFVIMIVCFSLNIHDAFFATTALP
ncbi:hypothetical protein VP01_793g3 [Puccinia sorghi]|uniref:Amino acid transporter transmembrane domain-containing protein n=1 Tax=Puccinia sorghi TaxID=27349 RepID=A0A0L6UBM1_9BASI|nr:hypothetical protein VP01_793g3 [Puccinia sorghi]